jgi:hypothetical protein
LTVNLATGLISGVPTTPGTYLTGVYATNAEGSAGEYVTITIEPPTPVITNALSVTGTEGQAFAFQLTATNNPTLYGAQHLPTGLAVNNYTGLISGTPTTNGTFSVFIGAANAGGTALAYLAMYIAPPAPVITSTASVSGTEYVPLSYQITATNSPTSYGATGLPGGLSVTAGTGLISGTPTASGTFTASVTGSNAGGTGSKSVKFTIALPPTPVITSALNVTGTEGAYFYYQITATYYPTLYGALSLPAGLVLNSSIGVIAGTPTTDGTFSVLLGAANSGGTGLAHMNLYIAPKAPGKSFSQAAGTFAGLIGESATSSGAVYAGFTQLTLAATGHVTGKLIYGQATLPVNGSFDSAGNFSGTPSGLGLHLISDAGGTSNPAGYWIAGSVTGGTGVAPFKAYHAAYGPKQTVPEAGKYTVLLGGTDTAASIPQGTGYAFAIVANTGGSVTLSGKLADGAAFSVSGVLVEGPAGDELLVFDPALYNNKGLLAGSIAFEHLTGSDCDGAIEWMRPAAAAGALYPQGFDTTLDLNGSLYSNPGKAIVLPLLILSDGGLTAPISESLRLSPQGALVVTGSNPYQLEISVDSATGAVSGSFLHPASQTPVSFSGVLYQNATLPGAGGFFIGPVLSGTSLSGNIQLSP